MHGVRDDLLQWILLHVMLVNLPAINMPHPIVVATMLFTSGGRFDTNTVHHISLVEQSCSTFQKFLLNQVTPLHTFPFGPGAIALYTLTGLKCLWFTVVNYQVYSQTITLP